MKIEITGIYELTMLQSAIRGAIIDAKYRLDLEKEKNNNTEVEVYSNRIETLTRLLAKTRKADALSGE